MNDQQTPVSDEHRYEVEAGDPSFPSFHVVDRWFNQKTVLTFGGTLASMLAAIAAGALSSEDNPDALLVELLPIARVSMGQNPTDPSLPL